MVSGVLVGGLLRALLLFTIKLFTTYRTPASNNSICLGSFLSSLATRASTKPTVQTTLSRYTQVQTTQLVLPNKRLQVQPSLTIRGCRFVDGGSRNLGQVTFSLINLRSFAVRNTSAGLLFANFISPFGLRHYHGVAVHGLSVSFAHAFRSRNAMQTTKGK